MPSAAAVARSPEPPIRQRISTYLLLGLVAFGLRSSWVLIAYARPDGGETLTYPDERDYWQMAEHLRRGEVMRDEAGMAAARMPALPALIAFCLKCPRPALCVRLTMALIGAVACVVFARLGEHAGGPRVGQIAGWLTALDPFAILYPVLVLTEVPRTFLLGLFVLAAWPTIVSPDRISPRRWVAIGAALAACVYIHPASVLLWPAWGLLCLARRAAWSRAAGVLSAGMIVAAAVAPWSLRNQRVLGAPCLLTTRLGISLYDGLGPQADGSSNLAAARERDELRGLNEVDQDRWFFRAALDEAQRDPPQVARLALNKFRRTWNIVPNVETHRSVGHQMISAAWMVPVLLLAAAGVWRRRRSGWTLAALLLPVVTFTLLHMVFVGSIRYRMPLLPFVEVLAACGLLRSARIPAALPSSHPSGESPDVAGD